MLHVGHLLRNSHIELSLYLYEDTCSIELDRLAR